MALDDKGDLHSHELIMSNQIFLIQVGAVLDTGREYQLVDRRGALLGKCSHRDQHLVAKSLRYVEPFEMFARLEVEVEDRIGAPVLRIIRPAKFLRSTFEVYNGYTGTQIGEVRQVKLAGRVSFNLIAGERVVGTVKADSWSLNQFTATSFRGEEVGRIRKVKRSLVADYVDHITENFVVSRPDSRDPQVDVLFLACALGIAVGRITFATPTGGFATID